MMARQTCPMYLPTLQQLLLISEQVKKLRHLTSSQMELPVTERLTMLQNSLSFSKQVMQAYL